jgi:hypothetical protein
MTKPLIAFHNDPALKTLLIEELVKHEEADAIVQGAYGESNAAEFKGCAVGCSIQSLNTRLGKTIATNDHSAYETELGIPRILAKLEDRIFEGLDKEASKGFPRRFIEAVNVGADLSLVWAKFAVWLLVDENDGVIRFAKSERTIKAIRDVADLYTRTIGGEVIDRAMWKTAAADAAAAAYADAATAYAATAAADAAAAAAAAADAAAAAAAYAADAAATATATGVGARKIHFGKCADKLIEILKETI